MSANMRVLILVALLGSSHAASAAPVCSQVLTPYISETQLQATINEIAKLRMELDLAKIKGSDDPAISALRNNYPQKLAELYTKLIGRHSESRIGKLITRKIKQLQGIRKSERQEELTQRKQQRRLKDRPFKVTGQIPLDEITVGLFEYIPNIDSFIIQSGYRDIVLINAKTLEKRVLQTDTKTAAILSNKNEVVAIDGEGKILIFNFSTGEEHTMAVAGSGSKSLRGKMAVSPNEDMLLVQSADHVSVIYLTHIQDGTMESKRVFSKLESVEQEVGLEFLSENEILVAREIFGGMLDIYNVDTLQKQRIEVDYFVRNLTLSPDRKLLLLEGSDQDRLRILPLSELQNIKEATQILPEGATGVKFGKGEDEVFMNLKDSRGLYSYPDFKKPEQLFPWDRKSVDLRDGEYPIFGTLEKMFRYQYVYKKSKKESGMIIEVWERD